MLTIMRKLIDTIQASEAIEYADEPDRDLLDERLEGPLLEALGYLTTFILVVALALYIKGELIF